MLGAFSRGSRRSPVGNRKSDAASTPPGCCYVEVYEQNNLKRGHLLQVPQLLQGCNARRDNVILTKDRVCTWLAADLQCDVTSVYTQDWTLTRSGAVVVQLTPFSEERAQNLGSPFRNGVRVVICCNGELLPMDAAARIQRACRAAPLCRALTQGLDSVKPGPNRARELQSRRSEIWTIIEQIRNVVQWTEEATKKCRSRGKEANVECLMLAYELLLGIFLGCDILESLEPAGRKQEYVSIREAVGGLNLQVALVFYDVSTDGAAKETTEDGQDSSPFLLDMLSVASRMFGLHSRVVVDLVGAACSCGSRRPAEAGSSTAVQALREEVAGVALDGPTSDGQLPPMPPAACLPRVEEPKKWDESVWPKNAAQAVHAGAQLDQLWRSTHHM